MKRTLVFIIAGLLLLIAPKAHADVASHVVISELSVGSATSSSQEFVELYNPTDQPVDLTGWQLQYHPAGSTSSWSNRTPAGITGQVAADGFFLLAPSSYLPSADAGFSTGMATGGGSVRIVDAGGNVIDLLGWGTGTQFEGTVAPAIDNGQSLERLPGITNPTGGNGEDTDNNLADFVVRSTPEPQSSASPIEIPGPIGTDQATDSGDTGNDDQSDGSAATAQTDQPTVLINELFIDPAAPQTDAKDEFIELYNPSGQAINLAGYNLKTGSNFHDSYTLPVTILQPGAYIALYSSQTKLSLTNSGGAAELLDTSGNVVDQSAEYDGSVTGMSFSRFGDDWQWTQAVTPNAANQMVALAGTSGPSANSATKSKTATKTSKAKAAPKTTKVKAPKVSKAGATAVAADQTGSGLAGKWLIIGLAALTLGYAIYEFRYDIKNLYVLAKRKYQARRSPRPSA